MNESQFSNLTAEQRKAEQKRLQALGMYAGPIDGRWGGTTSAAYELEAKQKTEAETKNRDAAARERADKLKSDELELKKLELQQSGKKTDVEAAETARKTKAREERDRLASEPLGVATKVGATTAALPAGVYLGRAAGLGINKLMDISQESKNKALAGVAADRTAGLTTREGARAAAIRSGAMPSQNALLRGISRMAPHIGVGGLMLGKGGYILSQQDPEGPYYPEMFDRGAGLAMVGAGTGILERGVNYGVAPTVAPDARAMAVIESNQLRRNNAAGTPAAPAPSGPRAVTPGSRSDLMSQAKRYGIKGRSSMGVEQLREAVGEAVKSTPAPRGGAASKMLKGLAGPGAAAGIAYAMTPGRAEAADGSGGPAQSEALTNAGIAGGAAYGARRAVDALPAAVGGALRTAGEAMAPATIDAMTDYSPDELAQGRNWMARNLPGALQFGAVGEAREMATVPEPSPYRQQPMAAAESLEIPQGIPAPREDGTSPYGAPAAPQDDFESQLADLTSLLQSIDTAPDPMQTAQASRAVTQMPQSFASPNIPTNRLLAQY